MKSSSVLVFGNNEYGMEIAKNVIHKYKDVTIFALEDIQLNIKNDFDFTIKKFDLSDNWDEISDKYDTDKSIVFCTLMEEAKNIFLTISLRSAFKDLTIIALANNNEDANKLRMAGASKVIPIVETTANIITDMLK
ncbi:MAG: NAD-binding protein, partial [Sulfurimonas sp.]|nr:NAD-binding protein [Sulfurimonas sp.]